MYFTSWVIISHMLLVNNVSLTEVTKIKSWQIYKEVPKIFSPSANFKTFSLEIVNYDCSTGLKITFSFNSQKL